MNWLMRALVVVVIAICPGRADAAYLFYGGDWYGDGTNSGATSNVVTSALQGIVYQNFVVPVGQTWTVTGLFSNNLIEPVPSAGFAGVDWSIRQGVSLGNGGTVVASGSNAAATITPTGRGYNTFSESTFAVDGLSITLGAGNYWMSVAPVLASTDGWTYNTLSFGTNGVGSYLPDNNFYFNQYTAYGVTQNFVYTGSLYSQGLVGTSSPVVSTPAPGGLTLLLVGGSCLGGFGLLSRARRTGGLLAGWTCRRAHSGTA